MSKNYDLQNVSSVLGSVAGEIREKIVLGGENSLPDRLESVRKVLDSIGEREQYFDYLIECLKQERDVIDELMYEQSSGNPEKVKRR